MWGGSSVQPAIAWCWGWSVTPWTRTVVMPSVRGLEVVRQVVKHCRLARDHIARAHEALIGLPCRLRINVFERVDVENLGEAAFDAEPRGHSLGMLARAVGEDEFAAGKSVECGRELGAGGDGVKVDVMHVIEEDVRRH